MSASSDLQLAVTAFLKASPALTVPLEILARRRGEMASEIDAAAANHGLCAYVMPPLPARALAGSPDLFFPEAEIRVQMWERPSLNILGADAYDVLDQVLKALHWQPHTLIDAAVSARMSAANVDQVTALAWARLQPQYDAAFRLFDLLSHPLYAAPGKPAEDAFGEDWRRVDAIFTAVYGFAPPEGPFFDSTTETFDSDKPVFDQT